MIAHTEEPAQRRRPQRPLVALTFLLGAAVVALDQSTKAWAEATLAGQGRIPILGDLLGFQLAHNPGAAFSIGTNATVVFTVVTVAAVIAAAVTAVRVRSLTQAVVIGLLGGAAASHASDRLFRPPAFGRGYVVDFLAYGNWFIGNVADIIIVAAAISGIVLLARTYRGSERR